MIVLEGKNGKYLLFMWRKILLTTTIHKKKYFFSVFAKLWYFLQTYILTINRFDLFLQGTLLVVVLLETYCHLLLRRDATTGRLPAMIEGILLNRFPDVFVCLNHSCQDSCHACLLLRYEMTMDFTCHDPNIPLLLPLLASVFLHVPVHFCYFWACLL